MYPIEYPGRLLRWFRSLMSLWPRDTKAQRQGDVAKVNRAGRKWS